MPTKHTSLAQLVASDAHAATFQTVGQYRQALMEHATCSLQPSASLQPVATAFFTEKGEVAFTGLFDRTLKALEAIKTTRMGISSGSIDLYAAPSGSSDPAPDQGQGEPVALPALFVQQGYERIGNTGRTTAKLYRDTENGYTVPLYTYADTGEVERLRAKLAERAELRNLHDALEQAVDIAHEALAAHADAGEVERLRAQLAERDALLDRVVDHAKFWHDHPYAEVVEAIAKDYKGLSSADPAIRESRTTEEPVSGADELPLYSGSQMKAYARAALAAHRAKQGDKQ